MYLSIKRLLARITWLNRLRLPKASSQPWELYRRCSQLPLDRFITCIVDSELSVLIISGKPSSEELTLAWGEIYYEYIDLSADNETKYIAFLQRDIALLHDEISNVEACLYFLQPQMLPFSQDNAAELLDLLKSYGYRVKIDFTTDYSKKLLQIEGKLALSKLSLEEKEREYYSFVDARKDNNLSREHFKTILGRLSKYQGYHVRAHEITVDEYVALLKDYTSYIEQSNRREVDNG